MPNEFTRRPQKYLSKKEQHYQLKRAKQQMKFQGEVFQHISTFRADRPAAQIFMFMLLLVVLQENVIGVGASLPDNPPSNSPSNNRTALSQPASVSGVKLTPAITQSGVTIPLSLDDFERASYFLQSYREEKSSPVNDLVLGSIFCESFGASLQEMSVRTMDYRLFFPPQKLHHLLQDVCTIYEKQPVLFIVNNHNHPFCELRGPSSTLINKVIAKIREMVSEPVLVAYEGAEFQLGEGSQAPFLTLDKPEEFVLNICVWICYDLLNLQFPLKAKNINLMHSLLIAVDNIKEMETIFIQPTSDAEIINIQQLLNKAYFKIKYGQDSAIDTFASDLHKVPDNRFKLAKLLINFVERIIASPIPVEREFLTPYKKYFLEQKPLLMDNLGFQEFEYNTEVLVNGRNQLWAKRILAYLESPKNPLKLIIVAGDEHISGLYNILLKQNNIMKYLGAAKSAAPLKMEL